VGPGPYLGLSTRSGADGIEVLEVAPGSPAESAGLRPGDVLIAVNGRALQPTQPLGPQIVGLQAGVPVPLTLIREGVTQTLVLTPRARPSATPAPLPSNTPPPGGAWVGFGLVEDSSGVRIEKVVDGSPAATVGLRKDDIVTLMDGAAMKTVGQVQAFLSGKAAGQIIKITVTRANQPLEFTLTLGQAPAPMAVPTTSAPPAASPENPPTAAPPTAAPPAPRPTPTVDPSLGLPTGQRVPLGVGYEVVTDALAKERNLPVTEGALIIAVTPGSPAALSGLLVGDIITEVEGDKVDAKRTLPLRMLPYTAGDTVILTVIRAGQTLRVLVTLSVRGVA
jgi:S1-C subfamily serine protease